MLGMQERPAALSILQCVAKQDPSSKLAGSVQYLNLAIVCC